MVGHDLRNPLQVIFYSVYLLKKMVDSASIPPEQKKSLNEQVDIISEQAQYMNKIVSDLQDFAKPIKAELTEVYLRRLVDDALSSIQFKQNIELSIRIPDDFPTLMLDPLLMRRVFVNLFTNAVQSMPNGGKLTVSAFKGKDSVKIYVSDTGVGIPEENLGKMFTPLFTTKAKGQGFGLAVCKRLVEAHGGTINVESEVGKGSTFVISLPLEGQSSKEINQNNV
ncbi:histidine kinase, partial [Candidatus Bathyarchaeota archaeon]|nr:histidine kinase [Candidatus Bathyarchaeota archaeon]